MQKVDKSILVWNLETSTKLSRRNEKNLEKKVNSFFLLFLLKTIYLILSANKVILSIFIEIASVKISEILWPHPSPSHYVQTASHTLG